MNLIQIFLKNGRRYLLSVINYENNFLYNLDEFYKKESKELNNILYQVNNGAHISGTTPAQSAESTLEVICLSEYDSNSETPQETITRINSSFDFSVY